MAVGLKRERSVEWRIAGSGLPVRKTMAAMKRWCRPALLVLPLPPSTDAHDSFASA